MMLPVAILAGGLATRLRPITQKIPKSLVDIAGQPFICRQLEYLATQGVKQVTLCIGHLGEMLRASGCGVNLWLDKVPLLPGALTLAGSGVRSSIAQANAQALADYRLAPDLDVNRLALLADPQTSGGLLACVAPDRVEDCIHALREAGIHGAVIGELREASHWQLV